ncbi:MAG: sodium:pantothenate symporter [Dethiosulfovibrio peptidovorans]|nr:MAG: sodium:pantothenate symporter [Dethiosulfovibrio peptidovorans]
MTEERQPQVLKKNEYGFIEDPRYKICEREALYGVILGIVNLVIWIVGGYGLGGGPVENYSYILGFPAWFFISCIANSVFAIVMTIYIVKKKMREMPLDPMTEGEAEAFIRDGGERV